MIDGWRSMVDDVMLYGCALMIEVSSMLADGCCVLVAG